MLATVVISSITLLGGLIFSFATGLAFALGVGVGHGAYEYSPLVTSGGTAPRSWYARWARRHHFSHHFTDARYNHGVTTPLWDLVFRTYRAPDKIHVPRKLAMDWLLDESGELASRFSADYALKGRSSRALIHPPT